ncbi:MAG TPA: DUF4249 domain-containing protein [Bacteroidales bacterium]|nr:DUF4249 domain-containing protein [Bacteroidales bacterium]
MKTIIKLSCFVTVLSLVLSCEKELDLSFPVTPSQMVIEGWIENGMPAQVILSHSAPYFSAIDSNNIIDFSETHAKVTLYSGSDHEILTLKPNQSYFPPYLYKSSRIKGTYNQSYTLEIIKFDTITRQYDTITASTTIPEPVELDSVWFETDPGMETKGRIWIRLSDDGSKANYYRLLYKRKGKDSRYVATNISTFNDVMINGKTAEMGFLRGYSSLADVEKENYFEKGDTVSIKFCTIDKEQFDFWNVYQSKVIASANPLATSNNLLKSNIKGGLGMWTGYGATYYLVIVK